jgi:hypothetical protein
MIRDPHFHTSSWGLEGCCKQRHTLFPRFPGLLYYQPPDYRAACVTLASPHQFCHPSKQKQHKHHHSVRTICLLLQSLIHFFIPLFPPSHGKYFRAPQRLPASVHPPAYILDLPLHPRSPRRSDLDTAGLEETAHWVAERTWTQTWTVRID